jgi:6-phosphogluconolactonase
VEVSPDGKFVYGSNRGHDSIVIYSVGADGRLTLVGHENGGGDVKVPRDFTIDPTGKFVLVANQKGDSITVFKRDTEKGTLTKLNTTKVPPGPSFVGVMP